MLGHWLVGNLSKQFIFSLLKMKEDLMFDGASRDPKCSRDNRIFIIAKHSAHAFLFTLSSDISFTLRGCSGITQR